MDGVGHGLRLPSLHFAPAQESSAFDPHACALNGSEKAGGGVGNTLGIGRSSRSGAPAIQPDAPASRPASPSRVAPDAPVGLRAAPKRPEGATEQLSPRRSELPRLHGETRTRSTDMDQGRPHEIQPARPTLGELLTRERQELAELRAGSDQVDAPPQHHIAQSGQPHRPTLGHALAEERRQETTERAQRAELVQSALPDGGGVMKRLKDRAARKAGEKWHTRLSSPKPMEGQRRKDFEKLVRADVMAMARTGKMDPTLAARTMHAAVVDETLGEGILAEDRKLLLEVLDELANPIARLFGQHKLRHTSDTSPAFTDAQVLQAPTPMATGTFNKVHAVQLAQADGTVLDGVFKPLASTTNGWVAVTTGIAPDDPQFAMRNLATVAYADKLGFDVIVNTKVAMLDTGGGPFGPELGLVMERAHGQPAAEVHSDILRRPDVTAEVIKLQLLDHLTGQGDRHPGNYFVSIEPDGRPRVTGIDNDQCFGKLLDHAAGIQHNIDESSEDMFKGTGLPPMIDTDMQNAINALTERDIRWMLGNKLSDEEIGAAVLRLESLKAHVDELAYAGDIIDPQDWDRPDVTFRLNRDNSYIARELESALYRDSQRAADARNNGDGAA
jgi:hypothetical protein